MREFVKVMAVLAFCGFAIAAVFVWADERPDSATRWYRVGFPIGAAVGIAVFLRLHFRRDRAPDYLSRYCPTFFDRAGFCFACFVSVEDGICAVGVLFQNRHERGCVAQLAFRPVKGAIQQTESRLLNGIFDAAHVSTLDSLLARRERAIHIRIECGRGAFGIASFPLGISRQRQGSRQKFEVGASVSYPNGKGRTLRFRDGVVIRHNAEFRNRFGVALTLAGAIGGHLFWATPATFSLTLPLGVAEIVPPHVQPRTHTLWSLGEPRHMDFAGLASGLSDPAANEPAAH